MNPDLQHLILSTIANPRSAFSIGGLGALAEFQDDTASPAHPDDHTYALVSPRGALQIRLLGGARALAYESRSASADAWQCAVGIIGTTDAFAMGSRTVLSELGPDRDAVRGVDRDALRFDLGVGLPNVDYCIRTSDASLIGLLRDHLGQAVVAQGHPLMETIIDASPHRVVVSQVARIEVYQAIDRHQTPGGPHTHLLPALLAGRRTHSANVPIPSGCAPMLTVHPENPLFDEHGRRRSFAEPAYRDFEKILDRFGDRDYIAEKRRLKSAVMNDAEIPAYTLPRSRAARLAHRIALRQLAQTGFDDHALARWREHLRC